MPLPSISCVQSIQLVRIRTSSLLQPELCFQTKERDQTVTAGQMGIFCWTGSRLGAAVTVRRWGGWDLYGHSGVSWEHGENNCQQLFDYCKLQLDELQKRSCYVIDKQVSAVHLRSHYADSSHTCSELDSEWSHLECFRLFYRSCATGSPHTSLQTGPL